MKTLDQQAKIDMLQHMIDQAHKSQQTIEIHFVKKNGEKRILKGHTHGPVSGKGMKYDPRKRGMRPLFDIEKSAWRMANLATTTQITANGETHVFLPEEE